MQVNDHLVINLKDMELYELHHYLNAICCAPYVNEEKNRINENNKWKIESRMNKLNNGEEYETPYPIGLVGMVPVRTVVPPDF